MLMAFLQDPWGFVTSIQLEFWPTLWSALLIITVFTLYTLREQMTRELLMVANRSVNVRLGAFALLAAWTQAAAVYASGLYAAMSPTHFWMFYIPNVLSLLLILMPYLSSRRLVPEGVTLGHYMDEVYGPFVRTIITIMQIGIVVVSCIGSLLSIAQWLTPLTGIPSGHIGLMFGGFAVLWVLLTGLKGGLVADRIKVFCLGVLMVGVAYLWWVSWGELRPEPVYTKATEPFGSIVWNTGVTLSITLIGAVFCFPDIAERANALVKDRKSQAKAIIGAAVLFALVLLVFGSNGTLASYAITEKYTGFPAFAVLKKFGSPNMLVVASVMLAVVLTAGLAAYVASFGSLLCVETFERHYISRYGVKPPDGAAVWISRAFMLLLIPLSAYIIVRFPDLTLPKLLEYSAAFRGEAIFPVLAAPILLWLGVPTKAYDTWIGMFMLKGLLVGMLCVFSKSVFGEASFLTQNARPLGALCALFFPVIGFCIRHYVFTPTATKTRLQGAQ